jgi:hypothetical protein
VKIIICILVWMYGLAPGRHHEDQAAAIARVVLAEPPLFPDDEDRVKTASLLVSIAFNESSFHNDAIGDQGRALCMFQLWHTSRDVLLDPELCTRIALDRLRASFRRCKDNQLGIYAGGPRGCMNSRTKRITRHRFWLANKLVKQLP